MDVVFYSSDSPDAKIYFRPGNVSSVIIMRSPHTGQTSQIGDTLPEAELGEGHRGNDLGFAPPQKVNFAPC